MSDAILGRVDDQLKSPRQSPSPRRTQILSDNELTSGRRTINTVLRCLSWPLRALLWILLAPLRLVQAIRHSMTSASVSAMLIGIMTLNIVWGYPWTGMFSACLSVFFVGITVNYAMRPGLKIEFTLPAFTPAEQPCRVIAHCTNRRKIPAIDYSISLQQPSGDKKRQVSVQSRPAFFGLTPPGERVDVEAVVVFAQRGMQMVPPVAVQTTFPFHLFRNRQAVTSTTTIAVTPKPLTGEEDAPARALMNAIGGWSHRLLSGDALDYTGSREYQPGMPVRRWDFASWARLGRPIVREFQSPSIQSVLLIVDTGLSSQHDAATAKELMERALSLAATALIDLAGKSVHVQMYVTSEPPTEHETLGRAAGDNESMQIRLAKADAVSAAGADDRIDQLLQEASTGGPTLLLTTRRASSLMDALPGTVDVICVDHFATDEPSSKKGRRGRDRVRMDRPHPQGQPVGSGQAVSSGAVLGGAADWQRSDP